MPLRRRISLISAAAVAVAILGAAVVCYLVVRGQLLGQVDGALRAQASAVEHGDFSTVNPHSQLPTIPASAGGPTPYYQIVAAGGEVIRRNGDIKLPVDSQLVAVANGRVHSYLASIHAGGSHLRVYIFSVTAAIGFGAPQLLAIELARPLGPTDHILSRLRLILLLLCVGGVVLAGLLGRLASRRVLRPLSEVTQTAQVIAQTDDLSRRLVVHADDEVGQLARRFNAMLERLQSSRAALDDSVRAQRQLVADASHELRTPVTSLRTNIEVLLADPGISDEDRRRLLMDVVQQSEELSALVGDLIELGRGDLPQGAAEEVRLDRIVEESVSRARRNWPSVEFQERLTPVNVDGVPERLGRAVNNLLENAAHHSLPGGIVEVTVDAEGLQVRDYGPGIDETDLPHIFDRFYRGANSRGTQGSGLGLAIVRQVATQHGGSVTAENAAGGGASFTLKLPVLPAETLAPDDAAALERMLERR